MRTLEIRCDNCGCVRPTPRPKTWYFVEDQSEVMRTGPVDLCSLACVHEWSGDPVVLALLPDLPNPDVPDATAIHATESRTSNGV